MAAMRTSRVGMDGGNRNKILAGVAGGLLLVAVVIIYFGTLGAKTPEDEYMQHLQEQTGMTKTEIEQKIRSGESLVQDVEEVVEAPQSTDDQPDWGTEAPIAAPDIQKPKPITIGFKPED
jgi:hypothetical protein